MDLFKKYKNNLKKFNIEDIATDEVIIHHHLGLGDHLTCNGLVNYLTKTFNKVYLPVKEKNFKNVTYLYKENLKVNLIKIPTGNHSTGNLTNEDIWEISDYEKDYIDNIANKMKVEILKVGHEKFSSPHPETFYKQLNIPFTVSSDYFQVKYDAQKNYLLEQHLKDFYNIENDYIVIHCESSKGIYPIDKLKSLGSSKRILIEKKSDIFNNIFLYQDVLKNAKEVHVIDSSFFCLADRIQTSKNLFLHNTPKTENLDKILSFLKDWQIINY
jgi:hypothetical protein